MYGVTTVKPGYKTTEFWLNLGVQIAAMCVLFGIITPEQSETLTVQYAAVADAVVQGAAAIAMGLSALGYSFGRGKAKTVEPVVTTQDPRTDVG